MAGIKHQISIIHLENDYKRRQQLQYNTQKKKKMMPNIFSWSLYSNFYIYFNLCVEWAVGEMTKKKKKTSPHYGCQL